MLMDHYANQRLLVRSCFSTFTAILKMKGETVSDLRRMFHGMLQTMGSLEGIGRPISSCSDLFVHLVVEMLDQRTRREWEIEIGSTTEPPSIDELKTFMECRLRSLEALHPASGDAAKTSGTTSRTARSHLAQKTGRGLKNVNIVAQNASLAELGMDSMMAVEIKQTLEREFDILLTAQDIRNLNFAKLKQMTDTAEQRKTHNINKIDTNNLEGLDIMIQIIKDSDLVSDVLVELATEKEDGRDIVFLIPGVEGCSKVYKSIASKIKFLPICVQHGILNIPQSHSVMKSAAYLLPYILKKLKDRREFLIVGYSFGSLIAIELARLLEVNNFSGRLILIDGAPDKMKFWLEQYTSYTSPEEIQNTILLSLLEMYTAVNKQMLVLELNKCNAWEEKLKIFHAYFPKELNKLSIENQKLICSTIYNNVIAIRDYNISSLPRLKSSITLLRPTLAITSFIEEDYGLRKVTEGTVQIQYVEGTHITMMDNDKIISIINEE
ncbi:PREDICTED: fatty acid synthase-like [Wasmannia auropunctata]|uniref:fatty acid synthase-like n=1 Tax=Wasmannia auropunctata TaxID=64793 RepID=UPI0005EFD5AB|nr:PREDICTED: fatty acid synthase-like [Wasmannia auropunctata]